MQKKKLNNMNDFDNLIETQCHLWFIFQNEWHCLDASLIGGSKLDMSLI